MASKYTKDTNGYYQTKVTIGYDPVTGKRLRKTVYAKTIKALEEKKLQVAELYMCNPIGLTPDTSLSDYASRWYYIFKSNKSLNTKEMYLTHIKHISSEIGHLPMKMITQMHIQSVINKYYSQPSTCEKIYLTLNQIFKTALLNNIVKLNPVQMINLPPTEHKETRALYEYEIEAISLCDFTPKEQAVVTLFYYFGLRPEELFALTKKSLDFTTHTLSVLEAAVYNKDNKSMDIKGTKTKSGRRTIHIPIECEAFLQEYISLCPTNYLITGRLPDTPSPHLQIDKYDKPISKWAFRGLWERIVAKIQLAYGLDYLTYLGQETYDELRTKAKLQHKTFFINVNKLTPYTFRHNYATMLYYSGVSLKMAARLMGHSDINIIMKIYAHLDEQRENAAEKLNIEISMKPRQ